jgi:hypothetical protein
MYDAVMNTIVLLDSFKKHVFTFIYGTSGTLNGNDCSYTSDRRALESFDPNIGTKLQEKSYSHE